MEVQAETICSLNLYRVNTFATEHVKYVIKRTPMAFKRFLIYSLQLDNLPYDKYVYVWAFCLEAFLFDLLGNIASEKIGSSYCACLN